MKRIFFIAIGLMFAFASQAQSNNDEVALLQSIYGMSKQQLVQDHMKFTEAEAAKFWKIYDEYEVSRKEIGKKRAANVMEYADNYQNLSPEKAKQLVKASVSNINAFTKLLDKTFKKLSKELSPVRAAQFYQIELFLEGIVRVRMADEIPLIEGFEEKK